MEKKASVRRWWLYRTMVLFLFLAGNVNIGETATNICGGVHVSCHVRRGHVNVEVTVDSFHERPKPFSLYTLSWPFKRIETSTVHSDEENEEKSCETEKNWKDWKVWRLGRDTLLPKGWAERRYMSRMMIMIIIILSLNDYRHHIKVLYHWFVQDIVKASGTEKVGHFCERGEESPQQDKNFETSGSPVTFSVFEIWPFFCPL